MYVLDILEKLRALGNEKRKKAYIKNNSVYNGFGVPMGEIKEMAKDLKGEEELAAELWDTENTDAMVMAIMVLDPKLITKQQVLGMMTKVKGAALMDELCFKLLCKTSFAKQLEDELMPSDSDLLAGAAWSLAIHRITRSYLGDEELEVYISKIEAEMQSAADYKKYQMNRALCEIGIRYEKYTEVCIFIGKKLGVYEGVKVAKGCVSAYAPDWISYSVKTRKKR